MSLRDVGNLKYSYNTLTDNLATEFYIPCLKEAIEYKRAVGFFSSNVLLEISRGLGAFADHHGKMKLLVSPRLEEDDYEAIKKGYDLREVVTDKLVSNFDFDQDFEQKDARLEMLAHMVATGMLEIKIVVINNNGDVRESSSLFHRKEGIFIDQNGNKIAFSGSGNETYNGLVANDEEWDVFASWMSSESDIRCAQKELSFDSVWDGSASYLVTIPFPEVIKNKLLSYDKQSSKETHFADIDQRYYDEYLSKQRKYLNAPKIPENLLYDYQLEAIANWKEKNYRGIFSMATGTGKTFAAAGAICQLYEDKKRLIVVVCCPQKTLVEQWSDELEKFNIHDSIKCYSDVNYKRKLERAFNKFNHHMTNFVCIITTNASFQKDHLQDYFKQYLKDVLIVVDEAHNFGADKISETLTIDYPYRLALSATFERYRDEEGTKKLTDFFGEKCIEYPLDKAIQEGKLCHYFYYPIAVSLSDSEYEEYIELTNSYIKLANRLGYLKNQSNQKDSGKEKEHSTRDTNDEIQQVLIKRARIVSGAVDKFDKLADAIRKYSNDNNILIYSGNYIYSDGTRQVDAVYKFLNDKLCIRSIKFTADETNDERKRIISAFRNGDVIQALVAINCLDEGIDIPAIKTAFILASTTNPRQYIQRRGRVLRNSPGKEYAEIYDFIVLPHPLGSDLYELSENQGIERGLVKRELARIDEFSSLSQNPNECLDLENQLMSEYELNIYHEEDVDDER